MGFKEALKGNMSFLQILKYKDIPKGKHSNNTLILLQVSPRSSQRAKGGNLYTHLLWFLLKTMCRLSELLVSD